MGNIKFKIVTPEQIVYEAEIKQISCPTEMGEITILPGHIPLVASLVPGEMKLVSDSGIKFLAVAGGFLEVRPNDQVVILADAAEHEEDIDVARAENARARALEMLKTNILSEKEYATTSAALERSLARIKIGRRKHAARTRSQILTDNTI